MRKIALLCLLPLLAITACRKPSKVTEYLGIWQSPDDCPVTFLAIYDDNAGYFSEDNPNSREGCHYSTEGRVQIAPFYLYFGDFRFRIITKPHYVNTPVQNYAGYYEMKLAKPFYLDGAGATITFQKLVY